MIGGVTGVLLALPPADWLLHNSTFLVAHFHNMLIPGALFGYLAGLTFWFPKAFGFRLDERWGRRSFWAWVIGFYLAFMPLYALGFMGMPRRMEHYDTPAWQPFLLVAALGAVVVLLALVFLAVQLVVSVRDRAGLRDATGDPWDGLTLEWATPSPPPPWNFAAIPVVRGRDAFLAMKEQGLAPPRPHRLDQVTLTRPSAFGPAVGGLAFAFGFGMVWHVWWLAGASLALIALAVAVLSSDDATEMLVPADEVRRA